MMRVMQWGMAAIAVAVVSVVAIARQVPQYDKDRRTIDRQATFVGEQHQHFGGRLGQRIAEIAGVR